MKKKNGFRFDSALLSLLIGFSIGLYFTTLAFNLFGNPLDSIFAFGYGWIAVGLISIFFLFFGIKKPRTIETIGFIFNSFVILQFAWDSYANDLNLSRLMVFFLSVFLLLLNSLTGHKKWNAFVKIFRRTLGFKD